MGHLICDVVIWLARMIREEVPVVGVLCLIFTNDPSLRFEKEQVRCPVSIDLARQGG